MKLIVTATAPALEAAVDPRFGRAAYFIVVDADSLQWQAHQNQGVNATGGAGALAAQFAAQQGVQAVISGDFGPNAYMALAAAGIQMYHDAASAVARGRGRQPAGRAGPGAVQPFDHQFQGRQVGASECTNRSWTSWSLVGAAGPQPAFLVYEDDRLRPRVQSGSPSPAARGGQARPPWQPAWR